MRVGWVEDTPGYVGGAEISCRALRDVCPGEIVHYDEIGFDAKSVDVWVIGNCTQFKADDLVPVLRTAPVVKRVADWWQFGDPVLRDWLLKYAKLVFLSPPHMRQFPFAFERQAAIIPPPINLYAFRKAREDQREDQPEREGVCWVGQAADPYRKGVKAAIDWANHHGKKVDFYGTDTQKCVQSSEFVEAYGEVPCDEVPNLLASYERFLFLPQYHEAFGRTVIEALNAGCRVTTNAVPGCIWYIENNVLGELETAAEDFWGVVSNELLERRGVSSTA